MNETDIKKLLVSNQFSSWDIQSLSSEQRFAFGTRRCDLMLIDKTSLIGFEIKSDRDNFSKLDNQLADYTRTFDLTYVVTTESMIKKLPTINECVGVILVTDDGLLKETQKASISNRLDVEFQLDLLTSKALYKAFDVKSSYGTKTATINHIKSIFGSDEISRRVRLKLLEQVEEVYSIFRSETLGRPNLSADDLSILEMRSATVQL